MTIVRKGRKLNVPTSWQSMSFTARMDYLVDTHQAKDHKEARNLLARQWKDQMVLTDMRIINRLVRLPYADN